eukprot:9523723-Lingulodinium_polyedra.AAC.1
MSKSKPGAARDVLQGLPEDTKHRGRWRQEAADEGQLRHTKHVECHRAPEQAELRHPDLPDRGAEPLHRAIEGGESGVRPQHHPRIFGSARDLAGNPAQASFAETTAAPHARPRAPPQP